MDRKMMLQTIEEAYAARVRGDLDGVMRAFAVDANFQINAAPSPPQLAYFTEDSNALRTAMAQLIDTFEFSDLQILDSVVEGPKAVVRLSFTVKARPTGKSVKTEVLDLFEFKDGKIAAMSQFCDTAAAAQLLVE
ncbi:MAG: hypothetical protein JWR80_2789 [Bradyrhizobium sp.]|nr:hypothetical protein [Bradyrhizobium sp.]